MIWDRLGYSRLIRSNGRIGYISELRFNSTGRQYWLKLWKWLYFERFLSIGKQICYASYFWVHYEMVYIYRKIIWNRFWRLTCCLWRTMRKCKKFVLKSKLVDLCKVKTIISSVFKTLLQKNAISNVRRSSQIPVLGCIQFNR